MHAPTPGAAPALALLALSACATPPAMHTSDLNDFATRYAAAWSGQDPAALAAFYAPDGRLIVNDAEPAVGRDAIAEEAAGFMQAFPDMTVRLDRLEPHPGGAVFYWIWTGTNTGPGGNGAAVNLKGYEAWTLSPDGLIAVSEGHYDQAEYERQMTAGR